MSIEAMKLALEALGKCRYRSLADEIVDPAITALRTAIAESEKQEPRCAVIVEVFGKDWRLDYMSLPVGKHRLYTQEYVYTTPFAAQRQPLTDEQIDAVCAPLGFAQMSPREVARAIEAAHGIGEKK
jgi:hypothetical protein